MKARSRLKVPQEAKAPSRIPPAPPPTHTPPATRKPIHTYHASHLLPEELTNYASHVGTLVVGLVFGAGLLFLMNTTSPDTIANWILPKSYLIFQLLLFMTVFFISSFLWLNSRRGFLTALTVQSVVFLKLQQIVITWQLVAGIVILFVIIEVLFTYLESRQYANLNQNSHSRHRRKSP